jgi:hypothetical protein
MNYPYVNVFAADGKWLGMFMSEETARSWLQKTKKDESTHEVVPVGTREARATKAPV